MELIVERISEGVVILEQTDRTHLHLNYNELKISIREGDVLCYENGVYSVDIEKTQERRKNLQTRTRKLFKNNE